MRCFCRARPLAFGVPSGRVRLARDGDGRLQRRYQPLRATFRQSVRVPAAAAKRPARCRAQRPNHVESRPLPPPGNMRSRYPAPPIPAAAAAGLSAAACAPPSAAAYRSPRHRRPVSGRSRRRRQWSWEGGTADHGRAGRDHPDASRTAMACRPSPSPKPTACRPARRSSPASGWSSRNTATARPPPRCRLRRPRRCGAPQLAAAPTVTGSVRNAAQAGVHVVAPGETLISVARRYHISPVGARAGQQSAAASSGAHGRAPEHSGCRRFALAQQPPRPAAASAARRRSAPAQRRAAPARGRIPAGAAARRARHHACQGQSGGRRGQARARRSRPPAIRRLPLAGAWPRHHRLRPEADRPAERRHQSSPCRKARRSRPPRTASSPMPATS